jgi:hypothetical protein
VISYFEAEILTGSTSIEGIATYPLSAIEGLIFYGFQVAIIADISIRYKVGMGIVYLFGLIYGIMEEGFALFTMEATSTHTLWFSYLGLNITWTIYVMLFHAVITVCSTILIVSVISKDKLESPFLTAKSYIIILPIIGLIYCTFIYSSLRAGRVPNIFSLLLLVFLVFMIALASIFSKRKYKPIKNFSFKKMWVVTILLWISGLSIPFILGNRIPAIIVPVAIFLFLLILYFYFFFCCIVDHYRKNARVLLNIYSSFNIILLILGTFNRTFLSDIFAVIALGLLIYLAGSPNGSKVY